MLEKFIILGSLSALVGFGLAYTMRLSVKAMLKRSEAKRAKRAQKKCPEHKAQRHLGEKHYCNYTTNCSNVNTDFKKMRRVA